MARSLRDTPPTSSVARLFDSNAAGRATRSLGPIDAHGHDPGEHENARSPAGGMRATAPKCKPIKREILLSREADAAMERLVQMLRDATGARLTASHVARALLLAAEHAAPCIQQAAELLGPETLPSNAPAYESARRRFESRIARAIVEGMRASAPLNAG